MKKYLSLLLACVLALVLLCACGKKDAAEQTPTPETPPTQTAATGGVDTSCKLYFPNDAADDLSADTAQLPDTEPAVTVAYAQAIVAQLIAHDALPKDSEVLAISKDGDALSLDMNEAFLAGLRASGSTGVWSTPSSTTSTARPCASRSRGSRSPPATRSTTSRCRRSRSEPATDTVTFREAVRADAAVWSGGAWTETGRASTFTAPSARSR